MIYGLTWSRTFQRRHGRHLSTELSHQSSRLVCHKRRYQDQLDIIMGLRVSLFAMLT